MSKIFVIGGGAAGMMAALAASKNNNEVEIFEKNDKLGRKLFITGKGRCNITNACDEMSFLENVVHNEKFLYSAIYTLNPESLVAMLNDFGLKTKLTRGNRVFPASDKSSDVIKCFENQLKKAGVKVHLNSQVNEVLVKDGKACGIRIKDKKFFCDKIVIATGGMSYKGTGSTGDGYKFAERTGHRLSAIRGGLVPFNSSDDYIKKLSGLSLKNIRFTVKNGKKNIYSEIGELLFTHFGVSGPLVLSASSFIDDEDFPLDSSIDLKPYLDEATLYKRIASDFDKYSKKDFINSLDDLLPKSLIPVIVALSKIDERKKCNQISKEERMRLVNLLKNFPVRLSSKRDINEAIITVGGVDVGDIDSSTMESKKVKGLYFIGEVLDLDALTGGYNLQIAFSTGYLCGINI